MSISPRRLALAGAALAVCALPAPAQWPTAPGVDLGLADGDGEEVQALARTAPDGHVWLSWYDSDPDGSPAFGYDVRVQRLAPDGTPTLAPGGVVVADRGFSSTQSYGLAVGPDGAAYLAFRDDRPGGVQITAARVDPDGTQPWGPLGVQLTATSQFVASPRIAATADGQVTVAWTQETGLALARLDAAGSPVWPAPLFVAPPIDSTVALSDLVALTGGDVAVAWVRTVGGFFGTRRLWAQKLGPAGQPLWSVQGVDLQPTNSLQFGNFPSIEHDGAGGVVAAWYGTGPLQCYAQRVLADGSKAYGAAPVELSLEAGRLRVSPSIAFDPASGEATCAWEETDALQADSGLYAQRLSPTGARLWGPNGVELVPLGPDQVSQVRTVSVPSGARVLWFEGGFGTEVLRGAAVDGLGAVVQAPFVLSSTGASRDDLAVAADGYGATVAAWDDDRGADADLFAKAWTPSGALGPAPGASAVPGAGNPLTLAADVEPLGGSLAAALDLTSSGHALGVLFGSLGGAALPFLGGTLLVDPAAPGGELFGLPLAAGPDATWALPIPGQPVLAGLAIRVQAAGVDALVPLALSNGLDVQLGL